MSSSVKLIIIMSTPYNIDGSTILFQLVNDTFTMFSMYLPNVLSTVADDCRLARAPIEIW